ncbi:hypothetical protein B0H10DRAFT_2228149 [Mycena sp. CBHHK59/15]|nr:hypothetical protein B0H10DRAFT_2228149 [Mycena sp. CBHHK59/15]
MATAATTHPGVASKKFLCSWDPRLTETATQMEMQLRLPENAARIDRILAPFKLAALQSQATMTVGKECVGAHLLTMGGYNVLYLLAFRDKTDILARLRMHGNGWTGDTSCVSAQDLEDRFLSEVATLRFLKTKTSIPVPKVYYCDPDETNPVGTRYMLMERMSGVLLTHIIPELTAVGRQTVLTQLAKYEVELYDTPLASIGMLIHENGTVGPVGPSCTGLEVVPSNRGPFRSSKQLLLACVDTELDLVRTADWTNLRGGGVSSFNGGVEGLPAEYAKQWFLLLHGAIETLPDELRFPPVFRLAHTDCNEGSILVSSGDDPTVVGVVDWEGARVIPAWDGRYAIGRSFLHWREFGEEERVATRGLYEDITTADGRCPGASALCFAGLMAIFESHPCITSDRKRLDKRFLEWLVSAERTGMESFAAELKGFHRLEEFIKDSQEITVCNA